MEFMYDILPTPISETNEYGTVDLVDVSPRMCPKGRTCEYAAVRAARTSYGSGLRSKEVDNGLLYYLIRNEHTSPLEFVEFVFKIECPIFVARQIMRHRTFSFNEYSLRYSEVKDKFFIPTELRGSDDINKQSSRGVIESNSLIAEYTNLVNESYEFYSKMIKAGVCREQARMVLPVSTFTTLYAKIDMNNLFKFLRLRMDEHTQKETREIANMMYRLAKTVAPIAFGAFDSYIVNSIKFTKEELKAIVNNYDLATSSKTEKVDFKRKKDYVVSLFDEV